MSELIKYEAACRAVAECKAVDEVKGIHDKAEAMRVYARLAGDKSMEIDAAEIRIRAERRLGEMLADEKAAGGLDPAASLKRGPVVVAHDHGKRPATLADAGISKDLSSRAQKLAAVPPAEFEAEVGEWRDRVHAEGARVTTRLEQAGERAIRAGRATAPRTAAAAQRAQVAQDAHGDSDLVATLEETQKEVERLQAEIAAAEADDLKAEVLKQKRLAVVAQRAQGEAMDRVLLTEKREARTMRWLRRCGKAVGEDDPDRIAKAVEDFVSVRRGAAA